jgi:hypothetical protein
LSTDALIAELTSPTYTFTSPGKMVVEAKADMKKRGLRSPDLADAFLLTFACGTGASIDTASRSRAIARRWLCDAANLQLGDAANLQLGVEGHYLKPFR